MRLFIAVSWKCKLIGGWSSGDVGESYGEGFPLDNLNKWCNQIAFFELDQS